MHEEAFRRKFRVILPFKNKGKGQVAKKKKRHCLVLLPLTYFKITTRIVIFLPFYSK